MLSISRIPRARSLPIQSLQLNSAYRCMFDRIRPLWRNTVGSYGFCAFFSTAVFAALFRTEHRHLHSLSRSFANAHLLSSTSNVHLWKFGQRRSAIGTRLLTVYKRNLVTLSDQWAPSTPVTAADPWPGVVGLTPPTGARLAVSQAWQIFQHSTHRQAWSAAVPGHVTSSYTAYLSNGCEQFSCGGRSKKTSTNVEYKRL